MTFNINKQNNKFKLMKMQFKTKINKFNKNIQN